MIFLHTYDECQVYAYPVHITLHLLYAYVIPKLLLLGAGCCIYLHCTGTLSNNSM